MQMGLPIGAILAITMTGIVSDMNGGLAGNGWRLLGRDIDLRTNTPLTGYENQGLYSPYRQGTRLYLAAPDGSELGFTFNPLRHNDPGVTYFTPAWDLLPTSPTGWKLETPNLKLMRAGNLFFELTTSGASTPSTQTDSIHPELAGATA